MDKQNIALVLSSGGARGFAHIGVIKAIEASGHKITSISGTSIGSLIGGIKAMEQLDLFEQTIVKLTPRQIYNMLDFKISRHGFLRAAKVFEFLESIIPDRTFEELETHLSIVASDITNAQEVVFTSGSVYRAIRASIAIPAVITAVKEHDRMLVDGAIVNPLPINRVKRTPQDLVVAVNLYDTIGDAAAAKTNDSNNFFDNCNGYVQKLYNGYRRIYKNESGPDYLSIVNLSANMMSERIAQMSILTEKPDIVINIPSKGIGIFDFHRSQELIDLGAEITYQTLKAR